MFPHLRFHFAALHTRKNAHSLSQSGRLQKGMEVGNQIFVQVVQAVQAVRACIMFHNMDNVTMQLLMSHFSPAPEPTAESQSHPREQSRAVFTVR